MKALKKIFIILIVFALILFVLSYLDYFLVKKSNSLPKFAIKKINKEKEMVTYNALFYRVWYCTADGTNIVGDYQDKDPICPVSYQFENGYYINTSNLKIPKRSLLLMINNNIYTREMIDIMSSDDEIKNAVYVSETYGKTFPKIVDEKKGTILNKSDEYSIVVFPEFKENKEKGTYEWIYDTTKEDNYYCAYVNKEDKQYKYSKFINGYCEDSFNKIKMETKWCELYQKSTLVYNEELTKYLCEE